MAKQHEKLTIAQRNVYRNRVFDQINRSFHYLERMPHSKNTFLAVKQTVNEIITDIFQRIEDGTI